MNILFYETFCKSKKAIASLKPGTSTGRVAFHKNIVQVEDTKKWPLQLATNQWSFCIPMIIILDSY